MAGASDKVRFYMEQAVPQLREFEEKKIFTKDEIRSLVKKRSDFEHLLLARGCPPPPSPATPPGKRTSSASAPRAANASASNPHPHTPDKRAFSPSSGAARASTRGTWGCG
ncbi:hypothetical protein V490_03140 [Pseudogymnoascus sp. VKM F-3557]|nr:hypothetical protein V490_03140 [Pseudogymnoascus sp. VKM F-3557]